MADARGKAKRALRERMRRVRAALPPAERAALAERIEATLLALPEVGEARTILLFYSFGSEVPTGGLAARLLAEGRRLLLPYLAEGGMEAAEVRAGDPMSPTHYGPKEPERRVPVDPAEVDAVITPGLAFDRRGYRLGYGGGYYDRYLARLPSRTLRIGLAFSVQLVEEVPHDPADQPVDLVVTDVGVTRCRRDRRPGPEGGPHQPPL